MDTSRYIAICYDDMRAVAGSVPRSRFAARSSGRPATHVAWSRSDGECADTGERWS